MANNPQNASEERDFVEFRRKVRQAEVLSASLEKLLLSLRFTGPAKRSDAEWTRAEIGI